MAVDALLPVYLPELHLRELMIELPPDHGARLRPMVQEFLGAVERHGAGAAKPGRDWDRLRAAVRRFHDDLSVLLALTGADSQARPAGRFLPAKWYEDATEGQLSADTIRHSPRKSLVRTSGDDVLAFEFESVCKTWGQYEGLLRLALAKGDGEGKSKEAAGKPGKS